jgi:ectoine hydroxylase
MDADMMGTEAPRAAIEGGLNDEQLKAFETDGFVVIPGALTSQEVDRYRDAVDRVYERLGTPGKILHTLAFVGEDEAFLDLLAHPWTFPLVVQLLGYNIFMFHCHLDVHPTEPKPEKNIWMWHQDGSVINRDIESIPRPRMSVKLAYFLTDVSEPGYGNFMVIPGSHLWNDIERPADDDNDLPGSIPVLASPGDAVFFDRRIWHARSRNYSDRTRKAVFFAYTFRWVRNRDDMYLPPEMLEKLNPVQRQLLDRGNERAIDYWMPDGVDLPVREMFEGPRQKASADQMM